CWAIPADGPSRGREPARQRGGSEIAQHCGPSDSPASARRAARIGADSCCCPALDSRNALWLGQPAKVAITLRVMSPYATRSELWSALLPVRVMRNALREVTGERVRASASKATSRGA